MPSPFPGVDPYLEAQGYWADFHVRFTNYLAEAIADRLPDAYEARIDEWIVMVDPLDERGKPFKPDVSVAVREGRREADGGVAVALAVEPVTIPILLPEEASERFVEIRRLSDRELVTVVELLSPGNKSGSARGEYLRKRAGLFRSSVNVVEVDLLLGGQRLPMARPLPRGDFYAFVTRGERVPDCDVYAWSVRQALPTIPVPLKAPDPDVLLDLAAVFATTYERGRYRRSVDYAAAPPAGLGPEDLGWAAATVRGPA